MASLPPSKSISLSKSAKLISLFCCILILWSPAARSSSDQFELEEEDEAPIPAIWPPQFNALLFMNYSGILEMIDLWYDWPNGRNLNIMHKQQGSVVYDVEWNNGTSFVYHLDSTRKCSTAQLEVGILRRNWLDGAKYLGRRRVDGFLCNVWEKVDFIWYYEDVVTKRPVHWVFYTGREAHVMTYEEGAVLEDAKWQAPPYCFDNTTGPVTGPAALPRRKRPFFWTDL